MNKRTKLYDAIKNTYAQAIHEQINSITISQCLGCMIGTDSAHDICNNREKCVDEYFEVALNSVDEINITNMLKQCNVINPPSKSKLMQDEIWCNSVKNIIKLM